MATTKNISRNKASEQHGKDKGSSMPTGRSTDTLPGEHGTKEKTRDTDPSSKGRKGADTTRMDRDRTDSEVAGGRTAGQDPTGERDLNQGEMLNEAEEDNEPLPGSEDVEVESDEMLETEDAIGDDDAAETATK